MLTLVIHKVIEGLTRYADLLSIFAKTIISKQIVPLTGLLIDKALTPMPPKLETKRLRLRSPSWDDFPHILKLGSNPNVMRFINNSQTQSPAEAKKDLERRIRQTNRHTGYWVTEHKDQDTFVGWMALKQLDRTRDYEIGYRFMEEFWGQGLATEAGEAVLEYAFQTLNLAHVVAVAQEHNFASTRVMEKLGLEKEREGIFYNTECVYYKITRDKYWTTKT